MERVHYLRAAILLATATLPGCGAAPTVRPPAEPEAAGAVTGWEAAWAEARAAARREKLAQATHPGVGAAGPTSTPLGPPALCQIAVRPDRAAVRPGTWRAAGMNSVPATIATLLFLGDRYEVRLNLPGAQSLLVQLPRDRAWQVGQAVTLEFAPEVACPWTA